MTILSGHPDYQEYAQWQGPNLAPAGTITFPPGITTIIPVTPVTQFAGTQIRCLGTGGRFRLIIRYWLDAAGTVSMGSDGFSINTTTGLLWTLHQNSPYFSIDLNNTGAGNATCVLWVNGTNIIAGRSFSPVVNNRFGATLLSVPASGNVQLTAPWIHSGWGWLSWTPQDSSAKLGAEVANVDEGGNVVAHLIDNIQTAGTFTALFQTAPDPVAVFINNSDGALAHSVTVWVTLGTTN